MSKLLKILSEALVKVVTKKGTEIKRYKRNVGKEVSGQIYVHKNYAEEVIPKELYLVSKATLKSEHPNFKFNCVMYDRKKETVRFDEAPDFDTAREPMVGRMVTVKDGETKTGDSKMIWHHKWLWVKDNYRGFDVDESREWSGLWASKLNGIAKGNYAGFQSQLKEVGLS